MPPRDDTWRSVVLPGWILLLVGSALTLTWWGAGLIDRAEELSDVVQGVQLWRRGRTWAGIGAVLSAVVWLAIPTPHPLPRRLDRWLGAAGLLLLALCLAGSSGLGLLLVVVAAALGVGTFLLRGHPEAVPLGVGGVALVALTRAVPLDPSEPVPALPAVAVAAVLVAAGAAAIVLRPRALGSVLLLWGGAAALSWGGPDPWPLASDDPGQLELASDPETAMVVSDVGQHHVVTIDAQGTATGIPEAVGPAEVRLDIDRRALGSHLLDAFGALRLRRIDRVQLRVSDPSPEDPAIPSQRSELHIVSANLEPWELKALLRIGLEPTLHLNDQPLERAALRRELLRQLRRSSSKIVVAEVAPDRAWEDLLGLVTDARATGAAKVVLLSPTEASPPPPPPPPPPTAGTER